jgi:hypothetical protein
MTKTTEIQIGNQRITVWDYRHAISDFRSLHRMDMRAEPPAFLPKIDPVFLRNLGYRIPFVRIDDETYIFPLNATNFSKNVKLTDYIDLCVADLDLLVYAEHYFYEVAKYKYSQNPDFGIKTLRYPNGSIVQEEYKRPFVRRTNRTSKMLYIEYNLAKIVTNEDEKAIWAAFAELQHRIRYKQNDFAMEQADSESSFAKGKNTSYGREKINHSLYNTYGVVVKLQNGDRIEATDLAFLANLLAKFTKTFGNWSAICKDFTLLLSYSGDKRMYAKSAIGLFAPQFKAIGVSAIQDAELTFAHEMGHFLDYYLGSQHKRIFLSDDYNSTLGKIALTFRRNLTKPQTSNYQYRTKECLARAFEQYYAIQNNITLNNSIGNFCDNAFFTKNIAPLIQEVLQKTF